MNNKHLTLEDRTTIELELCKGSSRSSIARLLNKDKSAICKEVKKRRTIRERSSYTKYEKGVRDCQFLFDCNKNNYCDTPCNKYSMQPCSRRDRTIGVCNGCPERKF